MTMLQWGILRPHHVLALVLCVSATEDFDWTKNERTSFYYGTFPTGRKPGSKRKQTTCWTYSSTGEQYSVRIYKISLWYIQLSSFLLVESSIPSSYMQIPNPALFHTHISFSVLRVTSLLCNQFIKQSVTKPRKYKYLSHQQLELSEKS